MIADVLRANLMALATTYADATGCELSAVSKRFYGHTAFFDSFKTGDMSISIDKYEKVVAQLRQDWPQGAPWPVMERVTFKAPRARHRSGNKK